MKKAGIYFGNFSVWTVDGCKRTNFRKFKLRFDDLIKKNRVGIYTAENGFIERQRNGRNKIHKIYIVAIKHFLCMS